MNDLIANAHVHCLYTDQPTGLKLKLLNALYMGRFVIVNKNMLAGTSLNEACIIAETHAQWQTEINSCFEKAFTGREIKKREEFLKPFDNLQKTKKLVGLIWEN